MRRAAALVTIALAALSTPRDASACGGTFCDNSGPQAMPVDQRGENILFVLDGQSVEAHIQIQYMGNAQRFAWILPVQALPEFSVGSQALFTNLLGATVPTYGYQTTNSCQSSNGTPTAGGVGAAGAGGSSTGGASGGGGPTVVYKATVGAFDITVLQGGTADEVEQWLVDNAYAPSPDAPPILQQYLEQGYLFVAMKLTNGAGVDEIHPIVIKYPGNKPCVPIRLTRVAALDDMAIRTFFLANERAVPTTYKHVVINPLQLGWLNFAGNYDQVVSAAIDSAVADGHAFVTEYAGPSNVVSTAGITSPAWNAMPFATIAPEMVVSELSAQGLMSCYPQGGGQTYCQFNHPLLEGLLHQYLPPPAGVTETAFYGCLSCYKDMIDATAWNAANFAKDMDARIVQPGRHAAEILQQWPYLTRLLTRISPVEMTDDPEFATRSDLGDVGRIESGQRNLGCSCQTMTLPDGRVVKIPNTSGAWPTWSPDMPFAERIEDLSGTSPIVLVDNSATIDMLLAEHNAGIACDNGPTGSGGTTGNPGSTGGHGGVANGYAGKPGSVPPNGSGATSGTPNGASAPAASDDSPSGGCSVGRLSRGSSLAMAIVAIAAAGLARRRRNRA